MHTFYAAHKNFLFPRLCKKMFDSQMSGRTSMVPPSSRNAKVIQQISLQIGKSIVTLTLLMYNFCNHQTLNYLINCFQDKALPRQLNDHKLSQYQTFYQDTISDKPYLEGGVNLTKTICESFYSFAADEQGKSYLLVTQT